MGTKDYDSPFCGGLVFCTQFKNTFALSILTYPKNSNHKQVYAVYCVCPQIIIPSGKSILLLGIFMPFWGCKGGQSHENNQYWNSRPCRRRKNNIDGKPAVHQWSDCEQGNVDKGTTRTDTMILERQRGITIQTAVTSFCWNDYKINIVDTPGHMDFLTEAYRSLSVLDGAVLVISAKDGVQAQTRILFHALQKMDIPTIIFINKIDQNGIDLRRVLPKH